MASIQKAHWLFKERYNKTNSNHYRDFSPIQIDQFLTDATHQFIEEFAFPEMHQQRFDMIANLIVTYPEQPELEAFTSSDNVYEFKMSELEYPYLHFKRAFVTTNCGLTKVEIVGQGRLNDILSDSLQQPSKTWRRLVGTFAKSSDENNISLYVYTVDGFTVDTLRIEYVRKPKTCFFGGYNSLEFKQCVATNGENCSQYYNTTTPLQDIEINENYLTTIVDIAVKEAARVMRDTGTVQLQMEKINSITN
jgi:hypothetical protein